MIKIGFAGVWVHDQDEALAFYTEKLGWELRADVTLPELGGYRWLTVGPPGQTDVSVLLNAIPGPPVLDAATADQIRSVMAKGWAGNVLLTTDDAQADLRGAHRARDRVHRAARGAALRHRLGVPRSVGQPVPPDADARARSGLSRRLQDERAVEPGAADDDAVETEVTHGSDVGRVADPARCKHRAGKARAYLAQQFEVGAASRAVAVDRRADHGRDACLAAPLECARGRQLARLEPAVRPDDPVRDVDRDRDPVGDELAQRRRPERRGADDDPRDTGLERARPRRPASARRRRAAPAPRRPPRPLRARARAARRRRARPRARPRGRTAGRRRPPAARARADRPASTSTRS